jgi:hypothetical protein
MSPWGAPMLSVTRAHWAYLGPGVKVFPLGYPQKMVARRLPRLSRHRSIGTIASSAGCTATCVCLGRLRYPVEPAPGDLANVVTARYRRGQRLFGGAVRRVAGWTVLRTILVADVGLLILAGFVPLLEVAPPAGIIGAAVLWLAAGGLLGLLPLTDPYRAEARLLRKARRRS